MADLLSSSSSAAAAAATSSPPPESSLHHHHHPQPIFPNLPNDVALQCLARVPRSHHPSLSLVCKSWHSLLRSPIFYATRQSLNSTDCFVYLNLRCPNANDTSTSSFKWFVLDPSKPAINGKSQENPNPKSLISIHPIPSQATGASIVELGSKVYVIGGSTDEIPSSNVWILDTMSHKWEIGPKMRVGREFAAAGVVDGKIYVIGGCVVNNWARSMNWAEVFDPVTGSWAAVPSPIEVRETLMHASAVMDGKIYGMADRGGVVFDPELGEWNPVSKRLDMGWRGRGAVVDGVLYCYDYLGKIRGFDVGKDVWKELRGVEKYLPKFLCGATMANVGGKLFLAWEGKRNGKEMEVLSAEIEVKKGDDGELSGSIIWSDVILLVPTRSSIVNCLAVAL
ncbi:hypothetical protein Ancab_026736 [Ancistrocladus abbreviatus]